MSKKAVIGIFLFSVAIFSTGFYLLSPHDHAQEQKVREALVEGDVRTADRLLGEIEKKHPHAPLALYRGYWAMERGDYATAEKYFRQAHLQQDSFEVYAAEMLSAYLQGHDPVLQTALVKAEQSGLESPLLLFYRGLGAYLKGDYQGALKSWEHFSWPPGNHITGPFSRAWLDVHVAHALICEKDYGQARSLLEEELHFAKGDKRELLALATCFLGLSYLDEARSVPPAERESFYKIARFYLSKGHFAESFRREKEIVTAAVIAEAKALFEAESSPAQPIALIRLLEEWKAEAAVEEMGNYLSYYLLSAPPETQKNLCRKIGDEFRKDPFLGILTEKLLLNLSESLKEGSIDHLADLWGCLEALSASSPLLAGQFAHLTATEILRTLHKDKDTLPKTRAFVKFWKGVVPEPAKRKELATHLYAQAELLWQQEGGEKKGTRLMDVAIDLVDEKTKNDMQRKIEHFLTALYIQAEESNMVRRLTLIYDACSHFKMGAKAFNSPTKVANYLADASYLFSVRNYSATQTHAEWVLKLDPKNQDALRLFGLSSYYLGEYRRALTALNRVQNLDVDSEKALALSQALAAQDQERHIAQIETDDPFGDE